MQRPDLPVSLSGCGRKTAHRLCPALEELRAREDEINKNPFAFKLSDVVKNDSRKRIALTPAQVDPFMTFINEDKHYSCFHDKFVVLLKTGMRVSELCGLSKQQLGFEKHRI